MSTSTSAPRSATGPGPCEAELASLLAGFDLPGLQATYLDQGEFLQIEPFLPPDILRSWERELEHLKPHLHRNYIPRHKKGGSASYEVIRRCAPTIDAVYRAAFRLDFIKRSVGAPVMECPESDPHRCAL